MKAATLDKDLELQLELKDTLRFNIISPRSISKATQDDIKILGSIFAKEPEFNIGSTQKSTTSYIQRPASNQD